MSSAIIALLSAIFGAIISGLGSESYKRHRDRAGVASALAGEISAIIDMTEKRGYVKMYHALLATLDLGEDVTCPDVVNDTRDPVPVLTAHLGCIGALGGDVPERVARFYQYFWGVRFDVIRLGTGVFDKVPNPAQTKANIIRGNLDLWSEAVALGRSVVTELRSIAAEQWFRAVWANVRKSVQRDSEGRVAPT